MSLDTSTSSTSSVGREDLLTKRRKELFGDCALIEIIHLHDCLRGALNALEADVNTLAGVAARNTDCGIVANVNFLSYPQHSRITHLERLVASRFKVIWSVFTSHSQAEDEFIWPALKEKTKGDVASSPNNSPKYAPTNREVSKDSTPNGSVPQDINLEQEEYEEDHADEERMFSEMDSLLTKLREALWANANRGDKSLVKQLAHFLSEHTRRLSQHLMHHLEKEETHCMPLVVKHLSKTEIHELVGQIMGKRSADTIAQIMTMAVQNLNETDREEMVKYMKQSMAGTFFDRWLTMSGWNGSLDAKPGENQNELVHEPHASVTVMSSPVKSIDIVRDRKRSIADDVESLECKRAKVLLADLDDVVSQITEPGATSTAFHSCMPSHAPTGSSITSQGELEKLIRAVATNPSLTPEQKNTTIQGLRDSVWKSNQREKEMNMGPPTVVNVSVAAGPRFLTARSVPASVASVTSSSSTGTRHLTPPSMYFKKSMDGKIVLVWSNDSRISSFDQSVPLFSAAELAPTYHDGAAGSVLGCPHYARACKLRHPTSGRLYTCRLCCEQQREMPMREKDETLDRYAVTEVMCMKCNALQPAEDRCVNVDCESRGKPFAKYFCRICHLYDDGSRPIFHCPYCNTCRLGLGLGVDFRHCMRCNACVSLADTDHHCIPQKLQGSCPICRETLFQSTDPLRGLKCGHVMHLSCFTEYRRGHAYTCPLCMRSMEDMKDYFALLDAAIRMQPMPAAYLSTMSNIYCQDCCETGRTRYHFVGQKCPKCGSYNTRELGRVHESPNSSPR
jgi:Zinc-ribbon/CHY zinc finger/Ring finger domain